MFSKNTVTIKYGRKIGNEFRKTKKKIEIVFTPSTTLLAASDSRIEGQWGDS